MCHADNVFRLGQLECEFSNFTAKSIGSGLGKPLNPISEQLGIFLCLRCASLHRKLGTHISKVKSLSMDSWTNEQVEVRPCYLRSHTLCLTVYLEHATQRQSCIE